MTHASHLSHISIPPETAAFLDLWHSYVQTLDPTVLAAILDNKSTISSPAFWGPKQDPDYVATILGAVTKAFENFRYDREWVDGREVLLEFSANIGDKELRGIDRITVTSEGMLGHIEVMIRPANALFALAEHVKKAFESKAA